MPGVVPATKSGSRTYIPAADATIAGGQVVEARAGGRIGAAGAGSLKVLGVALTDAIGPELLSTSPTMVNGRPVLVVPLPTAVAVVSSGIEVPVTYAAAASFGDKLIAAANGQVTPAGADPDYRTVVGVCTQPDGVPSAGVTGLMRTA